jgi:DNA-directed RNA polymerase sigma subunit (sigma70/sigma32)
LRNEYGLEVKNRLDIVRLHTDYLSAKTDEDGATLEEVGEVAVRTACTNTYESEIETEDRQYKVARLLSILPIAQRDIVSRAFGIGYDRAYEDAEIAEELGYTAERVRQIKNAAVVRMKKSAVAAAMAM